MLNDVLEVLINSLESGNCSVQRCPQYYVGINCTNQILICEHLCKNGYCKNKAECRILAFNNKPDCK